MQLVPKDFYEKLEFDKIIQLLLRHGMGQPGIDRLQALEPVTDLISIERWLKETAEFRASMEEKTPFPMSHYTDISEYLKQLLVIDYVMPIEALQEINVIIVSIHQIKKYFSYARRESFPQLSLIIKDLIFDEELIKSITSVIDEKGEIRPDASPELQKIRKMITSKNIELDKRFRKLVIEYRNNGWLTESTESVRNGRRVLSVPAEHKRKIRGIIHDESATGKTAFIEPEVIIAINNDIFDFEKEQQREIYRILKDLSTTLRPYTPQLQSYLEVIIKYDVIQAKAHLARQYDGVRPKLRTAAHIQLEEAYHPLLLLKNKDTKKMTVPFSLKFSEGNRILLLSGPNAGGKSITMKSVGLLQVMVQAGLLVPVSAESEFGIFQKLFADIGDSQSLEDDLSTYSSRLQNMRAFLKNADDQSLVLIDEFGSGTDPKIGGAIAEGILKILNQKKVFGVITTHYSNLKMYAYKNKGIVNAAMDFDNESLRPTYNLRVGRPGSSYAFEIAEKVGLDRSVLTYAKTKAGKNERAVDELLVDLQREKKELEDKIEEMSSRERKLEKLIKNYESLHKDLEYKRKKIKLEEKEKSLQTAAGNNKAFEKLIREIKEDKNLDKAKELSAKVKEERKELVEKVTDLREDLYYQEDAKPQKEIKVGDFVKLKTGGTTGTVESIKKGKAIVLMGIMKMTTNLRDLQPANEPLDIRKKKSIQTDVSSSAAQFESKLDLRGLYREEAIQRVEEFVDNAIMSSATHLRIVHGKGNGVLRNAVKKKLREYKAITKVGHPAHNDGGDGVTVVEL